MCLHILVSYYIIKRYFAELCLCWYTLYIKYTLKNKSSAIFLCWWSVFHFILHQKLYRNLSSQKISVIKWLRTENAKLQQQTEKKLYGSVYQVMFLDLINYDFCCIQNTKLHTNESIRTFLHYPITCNIIFLRLDVTLCQSSFVKSLYPNPLRKMTLIITMERRNKPRLFTAIHTINTMVPWFAQIYFLPFLSAVTPLCIWNPMNEGTSLLSQKLKNNFRL